MSKSVFKALASPVRRDILKKLRNGAMSAGEIADLYDFTKPTLSGHFKVLKEADLVTTERNGTTIYYRLNASVADEIVAMIMDIFNAEKEASND